MIIDVVNDALRRAYAQHIDDLILSWAAEAAQSFGEMLFGQVPCHAPHQYRFDGEPCGFCRAVV